MSIPDSLKPTGPHRAVVDGNLNARAVSVACPACGAEPGFACVVDPDERPYPSTIKVGWGDPFHVLRSRQAPPR